MEPQSFCNPCDFKSDGKRICRVEEFYPGKGYCPVAIVGGMSAQLDCFRIHLEGNVILNRNDPKLEKKVLMTSKRRMELFQEEFSTYYSSPDYSL